MIRCRPSLPCIDTTAQHCTALHSTTENKRELESFTHCTYQFTLVKYLHFICVVRVSISISSPMRLTATCIVSIGLHLPRKKRDRFTQNYLFIDKNVLMSNAITIKNSNKINRTKAFTCYRLYRKKNCHSKLSDNFAAASETYIFNSNKFYLFSLYEHRTKHNNRLQYVIRIVIFNQLTIFLLSFV